MKKKLMALGMAAVLAFGAAGCGGGTDAKTDDTALEDFNIVLDWYPNAIHSFLYVAQEKGYFADEGLNLVINFPANTNDGISMPAAGKADIGIYYLQDAIQTAVEENVPIVSVGAVTQSSLNVVISLAKSGIKGAEDLAEESHILSAYAQGRIGQALELVEDEGFREMRQDILGKLEVLPSMSEGDAYLLAKDLEGYKNDLRFLDIMELWYRDLLTAKSLREEGYLIQRDKKDAIFRAAKEPAALLAKKAAAVRTARMRLAQNANFRLTMEVMLMDLKETGK